MELVIVAALGVAAVVVYLIGGKHLD